MKIDIFENNTSILMAAMDIFKILFIFAFLWSSSFYIGRLLFTFLLRNPMNESINLGLRRILVCGFQIGVFFLWVKYIERRPVTELGFIKKNGFSKFTTGFFLGIFAVTIITIILFWVDAITIQTAIQQNSDLSTYIYFGFISLGWFIQSASEEIAIRGWLIPTISYKYTKIIAIILTSLVFGIIHLFSPGVTIISFINLIMSGVFFALYAIKQECLWGVWGCHFGWNLAQGNIFGFNVSGYTPFGIKLFNVNIKDFNILTGGDFGPEGGLLTTLTLLIGIILISDLKVLRYKMFRS